MMKRIVLLLLLSVFILPPIWSQGKYKITASSLNVRLAPNAKSKILGTLNQHDIIVVKSIENQWARITFMGKDAYISAKYIVKAEDDNVKNSTEKANDFELHSVEEKNFEKIKTGKHNIDSVFNNWGIDFLPSLYIGASDFIGDYMPKAHFGFGFDARFQIYQKQNDLPRGWMSEASVGYALKGGGGMPVHYFTMLILPAGYAYTFEKQDIILYALFGLSLNFGGGHLSAYRNGISKYYYANPCDVGMQLKIATEWRKFGFAVSYDQGFINVIENSSLGLKNFGFNFHFYYRLWDIPHNKIYKP